MASKYLQKFPVPKDFPDIINDLAKEILRNQPEDIIEFSALYFKCLQDGTVLDYPKRGKNIPCDFKPRVPSVQKNQRENLIKASEERHNQAVDNSKNLNKFDDEAEIKQSSAIKANVNEKCNQTSTATATQLHHDDLIVDKVEKISKPESSKSKPESIKSKPESSKPKPESSKSKPESSKRKPESSKSKSKSSKSKPDSSKSESESESSESDSKSKHSKKVSMNDLKNDEDKKTEEHVMKQEEDLSFKHQKSKTSDMNKSVTSSNKDPNEIVHKFIDDIFNSDHVISKKTLTK